MKIYFTHLTELCLPFTYTNTLRFSVGYENGIFQMFTFPSDALLQSQREAPCRRNLQQHTKRLLTDCEEVARGAVEDLLRPSIENSAYLRSPINGNGLNHYRLDGQVEYLPTSSLKQPVFHACQVLEVPGALLFCMGGILSPDVKFSAHYGQIPPRRVHIQQRNAVVMW